MAILKFRSPEGKEISVDSPDGSIPSEQELDQLFAQSKSTPKEQKPTFYSEVVSPILSGGSTFAMGIPRAVAKAQGPGMEEATFPEQQTIPGKILRGVSEVAGFTAGAPGRAARIAGKLVGKGLTKLGSGTILKRLLQGGAAGATGGFLSGSDLESRKEMAKSGGVFGAGASVVSPIAKSAFGKIGRGLAALSGVEKEVYEEASKKGFRNVLQKKFYSKKLPLEIQNRIADNIDNMQREARNEYSRLTNPLRKQPFDIAKFRGEVIKIANRVKLNPFDTDISKTDKAILDGVINKSQVRNLGDALDLRRNLDDIIYGRQGELKTSFGKEVRDLLNKELHKNTQLSSVDKEWTKLQEVLKEGRKVLGDSGEKILERFGNLTDKQKQNLVGLERKISGTPFIEDLTNYSLAKDFTTKRLSISPTGLIRSSIKPVTRGVLRQGESLTNLLNKLDEKTISKLIGSK